MNTIEASVESCSMPREKVLEHVGGHHRVLLELGGEVFADHQAREVLEDLLIERALGGWGSAVSSTSRSNSAWAASMRSKGSRCGWL